jgi:NTP pyrophosphatase (non-canonical NTP hydrolase)
MPGYRLRLAMEIGEFQRRMGGTYRERDARRGVDATFRWLAEEVGELARALRKGESSELVLEFSDVLAWTASLANLMDVDLERAAARYADGCPKCGNAPWTCPF